MSFANPAPRDRSKAVPDHIAKRLVAVGFLAALIALWFASAGKVPAYIMPSPAQVWEAVHTFASSGNRLVHLWTTLMHIGASIAIAFTLGTALAFAAYYLHWTYPAIHQRVTPFLSAFSGIGWTLLAVIWFGVSSFTVVFTITVVLLPFALINLREGLNALDGETNEMARSFTRSKPRAWRLVIVPSLLPFAAATLRIMFGVAWKVALTAELFGGGRGLGHVINLARQDYDTATIFAVILFIIIAVTLADRLIFAPLERVTTRHFGMTS